MSDLAIPNSNSVAEPHPDDACVICMEARAKTDSVRLDGCKHDSFHLECINRWTRQKPSCPLCRSKITSINGVHVRHASDVNGQLPPRLRLGFAAVASFLTFGLLCCLMFGLCSFLPSIVLAFATIALFYLTFWFLLKVMAIAFEIARRES